MPPFWLALQVSSVTFSLSPFHTGSFLHQSWACVRSVGSFNLHKHSPLTTCCGAVTGPLLFLSVYADDELLPSKPRTSESFLVKDEDVSLEGRPSEETRTPTSKDRAPAPPPDVITALQNFLLLTTATCFTKCKAHYTPNEPLQHTARSTRAYEIPTPPATYH